MVLAYTFKKQVERCYMLIEHVREDLNHTMKSNDMALISKEPNEYQVRKMVTARIFKKDLLLLNTTLPSNTSFLAEGYQMLSSMHGTFEHPLNIGRCPDDESPYAHETCSDYRICHNYILLESANSYVLIGFTSSNKYSGFFRIYNDGTLHMCMSTEGLIFETGDIFESECFVILEGLSRKSLLEKYASFIERHHPRRHFNETIMGYSTAYAYFDRYTSKNLFADVQQLDTFKSFDYVQLDDGYQDHMGDWLTPSAAFVDGLRSECERILMHGKKVALWIAPFIVSGNSSLFKEHKEWLHTDRDGNLVPAGYLSYGGWRDQPWYVLDFGLQEVVDYVFNLFSRLCHEYNVSYFKLDALYFGAMQGWLYRGGETRIEQYRRALDTIRCAVGDETILEGINAPLWPSLGLLDVMRVGDNTERSTDRIVHKCHENFHRLWMHKTLWYNDADCLCLKNLEDRIVTSESFKLQLALALVVGGPLFVSDSLSFYTDFDRNLFLRLKEVITHTTNLEYDHNFENFTLTLKDGRRIFIEFNFTEGAQVIILEEQGSDFITGQPLEQSVSLNPHDAIIVEYQR